MNINDILKHWPDVANTVQRKTNITVNGKTIHDCDKMNCAHCNQLEKSSNQFFGELDKVIDKLSK